MHLPTPTRALACAALFALAALPAATQQTTVYYTWLTPPGITHTDSTARVMLMLSCPAQGEGPAYLSLVQPRSESFSETHLVAWSRKAGISYFEQPRSDQRQAALTKFRADLDTTTTLLTIPALDQTLNFRSVPGITPLTVPSAQLAELPTGVQLASSCGALDTVVFAKQTQNGGRGFVVQAGNYQFAERHSDGTPTAADQLETAIVQFFAARYPQRARAAENCPLPEVLRRPRTDQNVFNTRREQHPVAARRDDHDRWTIWNSGFTAIAVPYVVSGTRMPETGEGRVVPVPACGSLQVKLERKGALATTDSVAVALDDDTLKISLTAAKQSDVERHLRVDTTRAGVLAMELTAGGVLFDWSKWFKHPPAGSAAAIAFLAGLALTTWYFRRRERARWQRDPARYLTPEAILHPVELALALQRIQHQAPLKEVIALRNAIPDLRKIAKYRLPPSDWRRNLWETLDAAGELDRLYARVEGGDRHSPPRGWRRLRLPTRTEKLHGISPQQEAKLLFELKNDVKARDRLHQALNAEVDRFPGGEVTPRWLPRALSEAINGAVDRSRVTRAALARDLPQYFAPPGDGANLPPDILGELDRKVDRVIELLSRQGSTNEAVDQARQETYEGAESRARASGETEQRESHAKDGGWVQLQRRVETLQNESDQLRVDLAASQSEASQLRSGVTTLEDDVRGLHEELDRASERNEQLACGLNEARTEADEWRAALREVASAPNEASTWLRQSQETTRLVETHESLLRTVGQRIRVLVRRTPHTIDAASASAPEPETTLIIRDLELITERLEALYRSTAARLYRKRPEDLAPDPAAPVLDQVAGLERLGAEIDRLRTASPRAESVPLLVLSVKNAGQALESMASQRSPLDETDLAPGDLARSLHEMASAAEARWYQSLLAAAVSLQTGAAPLDPSVEFLAWLLGNRYVQQLTLMLRLREVINVYFRDTPNREAEILHEVGQRYVGECGVVVQCLRSLGVNLDPIRFLQLPPAAANRFEPNGGRPLLLNTATLHDIVVAKVRSAPVELARTVADVSDWGYECLDLPQLSKPTRGWLCSGLGAL